MKYRRILSSIIFILVTFLFVVPTSTAFAHGSTTVGDYTIEIGFKNEPALQGEMNGLDLVVTNSKTDKPVTGMEDTLQAEIIFGASKKTLKIEPVEGEDGAYTAAVLPTAIGDYTWHIFGKIEDTPVDISMTSSPTTFVSVVPPADASFPGKQLSASDLETRLTLADQRATLGIVVGGLSLLIGIIGLLVGFTRKPSSH
jgi:hypothetical protein